MVLTGGNHNLSGVMDIAGHTQPATTARYLRPQKAAAQEVLVAAAAASGGGPKQSPTPTRSQRGPGGAPVDDRAAAGHPEMGDPVARRQPFAR